MTDHSNTLFSFGEFEIDLDRRLLLRGGEVVPLKGKAFDLLQTLVENRGETVSKNDLLDRVWENRFVVTVPGTGYRFVGEVRRPSNGDVVVERRSLSRIVVEEAISESNTDEPEKPSRPSLVARRSRFVPVIVGILVATAGVGWFYRSRVANDAIPQATGSAPRFSAKVFSAAGGGVPERVTISPDGKTVAFVERKKGQYALRLGEIEASNSLEIIPFQERLYRHLAFAPDGKSIYFTARDASHSDPGLMRVSILGGAVQDVAPRVSSTFTFSPDGKLVAFLGRNTEGGQSALVLVDAGTGQNQREIFLPELPNDVVGAGVSWSPDGKLIAFASPVGGGSRLVAVDLTDNS